MAMTAFTTTLALMIIETMVRSWPTIRPGFSGFKSKPPSSCAVPSGISTGFMFSAFTLATVTFAFTSTSSSRRTSCTKTQRTLPSDSSRTLTARLSSSLAGLAKSIASDVTTKSTRCSRASVWCS
jgi:hypothetical protein